MSQKQRIYRKVTHHFFDELATFLCSFASVLITTEAFNSGGHTKSVNDPKYYLQFSGQTIGMKFTWYPYEAFRLITSNDWPEELILYEDLYHPKAPQFKLTTTGFIGIQTNILQSAFIRYYETHKSTMESKSVADPYNWPKPWNFARIVRNAFAHGGIINFDNPRAKGISWNSLTYDPSDNGKQILFNDITFVEVLHLLEEMDAKL